jgi:hypothetical protein
MRRWLSLLAALWCLVRPAAAADQPVGEAASCPIEALAGVRSHLRRVVHDAPALTLGPAQVADFSMVARAVLGPEADALVAALVESPVEGGDSPTRFRVPCHAAVRSRDRLAWRMGLAGYTARETADVVAGHLSLGDVQQARARLMAGRSRAHVAAFLEARWREPDVAVEAVVPAPSAVFSLAELEADLTTLASQHGLAPALVRAVIAAESAGNPRAVSSAGAIGLMQLMPATAAALGVNPWQPRENLQGGMAYLAALLRDFGYDLRLALIAYNAGPQHARAVKAGQAVAYRETRAYLDAIRRRYPVPRD